MDAPLGKELGTRTQALHKATRASNAALLEAAKALKLVADKLVDKFAKHKFAEADMSALLAGVIDLGLKGEYQDYPGAEQATMALSAIINAMLNVGAIDKQQFEPLNAALEKSYAAVEKDEEYSPQAFVTALKVFKAKLPK